MAKLAEILDYGYIVAADEEVEMLVSWNGSATFNFWVGTLSGWQNTDCRTIYDIETLHQAEKEAKEWLANPNSDPACAICGGFYPEEDLTAGKCDGCVEGND